MSKKQFSISATQEEYDNIQKRCSKLKQVGLNFSSVCIEGANKILDENEKNSQYARNLLALEKAKKGLIEVGLMVADTDIKELTVSNIQDLKKKAYRKALTFRKLEL